MLRRAPRVVPADWVRDSTTAGAPHQWWLPDGDRGEFSAIGIYNQFVYVDPSRAVVIVKLSSNRAYGTTPDESTNREIETIAFLRAIAEHCD